MNRSMMFFFHGYTYQGSIIIIFIFLPYFLFIYYIKIWTRYPKNVSVVGHPFYFKSFSFVIYERNVHLSIIFNLIEAIFLFLPTSKVIHKKKKNVSIFHSSSMSNLESNMLPLRLHHK